MSKRVGIFTLLMVPFEPNQYIFLLERRRIELLNDAVI
jgi:hypothetical protein